MKPDQVDESVIRTLADVAGIEVPAEDVEPLIGAFRNHLEGMAVLDQLNLEEFDPVVILDASWS